MCCFDPHQIWTVMHTALTLGSLVCLLQLRKNLEIQTPTYSVSKLTAFCGERLPHSQSAAQPIRVAP